HPCHRDYPCCGGQRLRPGLRAPGRIPRSQRYLNERGQPLSRQEETAKCAETLGNLRADSPVRRRANGGPYRPKITGESAGGVSPPPALRTGRDGLPSSGPHSPASCEGDQLPVCEQARLVLVNLLQPGHRFGVLAPEPFEFVHGPPDEVLVDAPCQEAQLGAVEGSVVVDPASHLGVDRLGEAGQVRATAAAKVPGPELAAGRLFALPLMAGEKPVYNPRT